MTQPIEPDLFFNMVEAGALTPVSATNYEINFAIVQDQFPEYMEHIILNTLNDLEQWAYLEGYMAYTVLPNGLLEWKPTGKLL